MSLSAEEIEKYHYDGVLAGHCICTPPLGTIIQELTFNYSLWIGGLDRPATDAMVAVWLHGVSHFLVGAYAPEQPRFSPHKPDAKVEVVVAVKPEPVLPKLTPLKDLAEMLKMDRSAARRYVLRLGIRPTRARTNTSGFQTALVFTPEQVRRAVDARREDGYC